MTTVIMINGLKRSGKDHVAGIIASLYENVKILSFADPLKQIVADTFPITREELEDYKNDKVSIYINDENGDFIKISDFRLVLQLFGTEAMKKQFGESVWADRMVDKIDTIEKEVNEDVIYVIPDFRFTIEDKQVKEYCEKNDINYVTINIINNDLETDDLHSSETELRDNDFQFTYSLDNTGYPENIKESVTGLMKTVME
jgi:hypothetical protein